MISFKVNYFDRPSYNLYGNDYSNNFTPVDMNSVLYKEFHKPISHFDFILSLKLFFKKDIIPQTYFIIYLFILLY